LGANNRFKVIVHCCAPGGSQHLPRKSFLAVTTRLTGIPFLQGVVLQRAADLEKSTQVGIRQEMGDTDIEDPEVSDGASENDYSDHDQDLGKEEDDNTDMAEQKFRPDAEENGSTVTTKPKYDPKDPLRPRRKKARRACFACQRAHLTCGMCGLVCLPDMLETEPTINQASSLGSTLP
jgi:hypothetical protein